MEYEDILNFWFDETDESKWWNKDAEFDNLIKTRFLEIHNLANQCALFQWRNTSKGRLAEIIVLDQFSRHIFRGDARSFASDSLALALAQEAVSLQADGELDQKERGFLYKPYMHSESLRIHEVALTLFQKNNNLSDYNFELRHKAIIEQFGRYPHRNAILGRVSSDQEIAFLKQPGSGF